MTYTVVQKVKDKYYLCEVDAVWDPVKKNSKQTRKYIGRCDKDGNLIGDSPRMSISSKSFGQFYLMLKFAEECGVPQALEKVYGVKNGRMIAALSLMRTMSVGRPETMVARLRETLLPELMHLDMSGWSTIQEVLKNLGASLKRKDDVIMELAEGHRTVVLESTAFAEGMRFLDIEGLSTDITYKFTSMPPTIIMTGLDGNDLVPFYYKPMLGAESDLSMIASVRRDVMGLTAGSVEFFLDTKSWDARKVRTIADSGLLVSLQLSQDSPVGRRILSDSVRMFKGSSDTYVYNGKVYRVYEKRYDVDGSTIRAVVYLNENRRNSELLTLYSMMDNFEAVVSGMEWSEGIEESLRDVPSIGDVLNMFTLSEGPDGMTKVEKKRKAISAVENRCGKMVIVTTTDHTWDELLDLWKKRSDIEYCVQIFKTDLLGEAWLIPSMESALGTMLLEVLAIRIQSTLVARLRRSPMARDMGIWDVLAELSTLKVSNINGEWYLNDISPLQRSIFEVLDIPVPTDRYVRETISRHGV